MPIKIITDSGSDLPVLLQARYGIEIVPLTVTFPDGPMAEGTSAEAFYDKMESFSELPTTASPSPAVFLEAFRNADPASDLLVLCMSSNISSTYQSALIAKDMLLDEGFERGIEVIDTRSFSGGLSRIVAMAAAYAEGGCGLPELKERTERIIEQTSAYFTLESLENVIKGGRLSRLSGGVASVLNIKLLLRISGEGKVEVVEKTRGFRKAVGSLLAKLDEKEHDYENSEIAIVHSGSEQLALDVKERILAKHPFRAVHLSCMGPVMGTYAGRGGIGVAF